MAREKDDEEGAENKKVKNTDDIEPGPGTYSRKLASFWLDQVGQYEESRARYFSRVSYILKRYRDERSRVEEDGQRRMNLLWAHERIMSPALYSKCPIPIVDRMFLDHDPNGRLASMMIERTIRNEIASNGFDKKMKMCVKDLILCGMGIAWPRYEPEIGDSKSIPGAARSGLEDTLDNLAIESGKEEGEVDDAEEEKLEGTTSQLLRESIPVDYISLFDFGTIPHNARTWDEVQAVYKRVPISKHEAKERFGEEIGEEIRPEVDENGRLAMAHYEQYGIFQDINERSISIYEIWNKMDRNVYWVSPGYEYLCGIEKDPLELEGFFPIVEPMLSNLTNDSLVPVPDFHQWQDQATQIDELTQRIAMLAKACKVAGTYNGANNELTRLMTEAVENQLIPVDDWAAHSEQGGIPGSISFLPLKEIQEVIQTLMLVRKQAMEDLDLITGVTDVMRGTTDSRETLGGMRLKNNNTGTRLSDRQNDVAKFARNLVKLIAEIACKHFSDKTLIKESGILFEEELDPELIAMHIEDELMQKLKSMPPPAPPQPMGMGAPPMPGMPQPGMPPQGAPPQMGGMPPPPMGNNVIPMNPGIPNMQQMLMTNDAFRKRMVREQADKIIEERVDKAIKLLRDDLSRSFRIDIETDSTVYADAAQERQDATGFITAFTQFIGTAEKLGQQEPALLPLMGRMLQFGVRKFRAGRDLEAAIDGFVDKMTKKAKALEQNPPPNPEQIKAKSEEAKQKFELQKQAMAAKAQQDNDNRTAQIHQQEAVADQQRMAQDDQREMQKDQMTLQIEREKMGLEMHKMQQEFVFAQEEHKQKMEQLHLQMQQAEKKHREAMQPKPKKEAK